MSEATAHQAPSPKAAFDLKAGQFLMPTLVIRDDDIAALERFLAEQVSRLPSFFDQAPIAIDLGGLADRHELESFPMIVGMLRGHGMIPVGVRGASAEQRAQAQALELAIMPNVRKPPQPAASPVDPGAVRPRPMIVDAPVRSGQRVYARDTDLILLAGVGSGAEVMADGHVHVYGTLRGRAMAGVSGDTGACIFCRGLEAELVSVAGCYRVSENLDEAHVGQAVQVSLSGDRLSFRLL
ncbi:MAG: septum site-determining protein MinC [Gammaproteobacteria bacterium]|nr:septum site-determining protein MinC [Gammaproteobacteria bacterium]